MAALVYTCGMSMGANNPGWNTNSDYVIRQIRVHERSSTHNAPMADPTLRYNCGANPNQRPGANLYISP